MKKNAIVIAGIMFATGCATNQGRYSTSSSYEDPSVSAQYDPAMGGYSSGVSGTASSPHRNNTGVNDYHADSSTQGGSNEARGWSQRDFLPTEGSPHPINPAVQADSSIRGGSPMARQNDWPGRAEDYNSGNSTQNSRFKADSSMRGGSNEARFGRNLRSSNDDQTNFLPNEYIVVIPDEQSFGIQDEAIQPSANWNPGDDLLADGIETPSNIATPTPDNDASVGGAAVSESGRASSRPQDVRRETDASSLTSPGSEKDLNRSHQLEKNISGQAIGEDRHDASLNSGSSTSVGGPGSVETGVSSSDDKLSSSAGAPATTDDISRESADLFRNNRAQGVGSAATGEFSSDSNSGAGEKVNDHALAETVKSTLTREESGTSGVTQREIARNVQVTSHDGTVVLKGTVPSQRSKDMLEVRAREISGVRKVDNQLMVTPEANPSVRDSHIGRDLEDSSRQIRDLQQ